VTDNERDAIMQDCPKPSCQLLTTPRMDEEIKKHTKKTGKDPHYGADPCSNCRSNYWIWQGHLPAVGRPVP